MAAVRRRPRKVAAKKGTSGPKPKKAAARKAVRSAKKAVAKKTVSKSKAKREPWGEFDEHGFRVGSDSSIIMAALLEGGADRDEINQRIADELPTTETRSGNDKNIPSLVSGILKRAEEAGYTVQSEWVLLPPTGGRAKSNGAGRAVKKTAAKKKAPAKKKAGKRKVRR